MRVIAIHKAEGYSPVIKYECIKCGAPAEYYDTKAKLTFCRDCYVVGNDIWLANKQSITNETFVKGEA